MSKSEKGAVRPPAGRGHAVNILLMMSGSIACAKASSLISGWVKQGHKVRVVATRSVGQFIGSSTLQGLGAELVFDDVFAPGLVMEHISLGKWADVVVVAPATSNLINKLAAGIADDAVTTVWQAAYGQHKPMAIAPAMNTRMWRYPATRESAGRLQQWGIHVLPVGEGDLACGESGEGRMLEPEEIMQSVDLLLASDRPENRKHILITAGGTREPIDSVRYIGNFSSGRTAAGLADGLTAAGHAVTWLGARDAVRPASAVRMLTYGSFSELQEQLREQLGSHHFDAVIHAAAVSDFSVARIDTPDGRQLEGRGGKLPSDEDLVLRLKRNPKLLDRLKDWSSNPAIKVFGFKLTDTDDKGQRLAAVNKQLGLPSVDAVVHNDLSEISASEHTFRLHTDARSPLVCKDNRELARRIDELMEVTP